VTPKAIVVYASPVFVTLNDLWDSISTAKLVDRSNFCQASKLSGHSLYTYVRAGNVGKGHSETEDLESFNFLRRISQLNEEVEPTDDNRTFLARLGEFTQQAIIESEFDSKVYNNILEDFPYYEGNKTATAMLRISAFNFVVGTRWLVSAVPDPDT